MSLGLSPELSRTGSLSLLLVEDSDDDAELVDYRLRKSGLKYSLLRVETEAAFRAAVKDPIDLIISDFTLPQFGASFALDILHELQLDIPLIIISGAIGEETAVAAMKRGAIDYLLKDRLTRLPRAVVQGVETFRMRDRQQQTQEVLAATLTHLSRLSAQLVDAQENERKNLARELHDELGQRLTVLHMGLHRMRPHLKTPEAGEAWQEAEQDVSALIGQVRAMSGSLRPQSLDVLGLESALRQMLERVFSHGGTELVFEYAGLPGRLPPVIEITAYRLVQESANNIAKHAKASRVVIEVNGGEAEQELEIIVRDNGVGFEPALALLPRPLGGQGLAGIRERVELLGGALNVESVPGQGTRLVMSIPLNINPNPDRTSIDG